MGNPHREQAKADPASLRAAPQSACRARIAYRALEQTETSDRLARVPYSREYSVKEGNMGRGILLWLLGVPIPIIILIALLYH
jgi:hypothetical protein